MKIKKASKKDIFWGYTAQFLNIGSGLIVIPFAIKYLSSVDLAFWYLFLAISSLAQLLEFGMQPTISRMSSYVYSGAERLTAEGVPPTGSRVNYQLLYDLISSSKRIYRIVSSAAAFILLVIGTIYLCSFGEFGAPQFYAWGVFSISCIINLYFTYYNGLIVGRGEQLTLYKIMAFSKLIVLLVSVPLLYLEFGLMSMAIGTLLSLIANRFLISKAYYKIERKDIKELLKIECESINQTKILWLSAWKLGVTSLGAFLILRTNQFVASSFLGLEIAASYGLTIQVISVLTTVSVMYFNLNLPKMNSLQGTGDKASLRSIFYFSYGITMLVFFLGAVFIILSGNFLLSIISAKTSFLSNSILAFLFFIYQLELSHSICATYLTTLNRVPFLYASLISGFFIILLSILAVTLTDMGLLGILLVQFIVQLLYNNWFWPMQAFRDLRYGN